MKLIDADKLKMSFKPYFDGKKTIGQIIDEQPTVEAQPNRCDSCTHSEEQDGLNCYECVKGMADNFEAQPTKMRDATEEERKSVKDYIESISKPTGLQFEEELNFIQPHKKIPCTITVGKPSEDCIRREAVINLINHSLCDLKRDGDKQIFINTVNSLPSVTPRTNLAETSQDCISILNRIMEYTYGMLTAEKIGLQHLIKSMMDELSGGDPE